MSFIQKMAKKNLEIFLKKEPAQEVKLKAPRTLLRIH